MSPPIGPDEIARITRAVVEKLGSREVDRSTLVEAVQQAASEPAPATPQAPSRTDPTPRQDVRQRVIVASFGLNRPGIVAAISQVLAENLCSIEDMSQRIMQEFYTLIMIVDISACKTDFAALSEKLKEVEEKLGVTILAQHEDVFQYMHRV